MCILVQLYIHYIFCSAKVFIWIIVFHLLPSLLSGTAIYFVSLSDMCSIIMLMVRNFQNFACCIDFSPPQSPLLPPPPTHTHTPFTPLLVIAKDSDLLTISQCYCVTVAFQVDTLEVMYVWACDCVYQ